MIPGRATAPFEVYTRTVFADDAGSAYTDKKISLKQGMVPGRSTLRKVLSSGASPYTDLLKVNGNLAVALYCLSMRPRHCHIGKDETLWLMYVLSRGFMRKVEATGCFHSPEFV